MTAAHCIFDEYGMVRKKSLTEVYLGVHSLTDLENKYGVEKFIFDKRFSILDGKLDHDFAILRLSENVQFNSNVYPICIPKSEFDDFDRLVVAGWGKLSAFEGAPNSLNEVEVEYIDSKYNLN
jgi:trypsin